MWNLKKYSVLLIIIFFIVGSTSYGQDSSLLYRISGNGLSEPSYLFGTIHMIPKKDFHLSEKTLQVFDSSEVLVTEIEMDIPLSEQLQLAKQMFLPEGKTYADFMTEKSFTTFYAYLTDSLGIRNKKADRYIRIKPVFLSGLLMKDVLGKIEVYEMEFHKLAKKGDLELKALESAIEQITIIDSISLDLQFKDLDSPSSFTTEYERLLNAYKNQHLDTLCNLLYEDTEFQTIQSIMLDNRNTKWIPILTEFISQQPCFIAVGAAHLCGEYGLINLFRQQGYHVIPLF